ncbi:hypothetical protein HPB50_019309 [Hyalomma asiaticum]|uniref:Uncharacterized protein n=1 Tax=Hyalomma asiaticum TaxID=266040 RepID=A0ACB7RMZ4_HYAAI|nr:hypothetical protein HPB50_019309 [Hyalomma asiaticum]
MRSRTIVSLLIVGIFLLSIVVAVVLLFAPLPWFKSQAKCDKGAKPAPPHTDAVRVPEKTDDSDGTPAASPFRHAVPDVSGKGVTLAQPRHSLQPTGFHVVLLMIGLFLLWLLRTSGLLVPALIAVSTLGALMVPLGQRMASAEEGGGPSCGLSAICRFTETARTNVHLHMELAGLPAPYVRQVRRLLALLENVNCDRIEQSCSRISLSDLLPF